MGTRGRKSSAELAVVSTTKTDRPAPPANLSPEQRSEWLVLVNAHAADHFEPQLLPLLEAFVRHRVAQRHIAQLIDSAESGDDIDIDQYDKLLRMQERESRCLASLAVRLGFAHTTGYDDQKKTRQKIRKPKKDGDYTY